MIIFFLLSAFAMGMAFNDVINNDCERKCAKTEVVEKKQMTFSEAFAPPAESKND